MLDVFFGHFFLVCSLGSCNVFYVAFSIPFAFSVQSIMYVCSVCVVFVCKMGDGVISSKEGLILFSVL